MCDQSSRRSGSYSNEQHEGETGIGAIVGPDDGGVDSRTNDKADEDVGGMGIAGSVWSLLGFPGDKDAAA